MLDPLIIVIALALGILVKRLGYPPMLGYLATGFTITWLNDNELANLVGGPLISGIADAGVTLLLFTIGLKLNLRQLMAPQIWAVASVHMILTVLFIWLVLWFMLPIVGQMYQVDATAMAAIAFALSFSSTVFAVKIFDEQGEGASLHARFAIGVLIIQDLVAVAYLALSTGKIPGLEALWLLLLIPLRPVLHRILKTSGHGELLILYGIGMAFGAYSLFELFNLKGDLGALIVGVLVAGTAKTNELSKSLLSLKDLFLVGFFISIGLNGTPDLSMLGITLVITAILVIKPFLFFLLFTGFKLRSRTSLLASLALTNYSEFGLIVAALAASNGLISTDWVVIIALALSISFFISVPLNEKANQFYTRYCERLRRFERKKRLPFEKPVNLGDASVLVCGMGRVGKGVYDYFNQSYNGSVIGIEQLAEKHDELKEQNVNVVMGDASDRDFWLRLNQSNVELILVSLTNHQENVQVVELLREVNFEGDVAVIARYPDELEELKKMDCIAFNLYAEAGYGFGEHVHEYIHPASKDAVRLLVGNP